MLPGYLCPADGMTFVVWEDFFMPFTAHDLRYHLTEHYAALYSYLQYRAKRHLGALGSDAFEVDQVVGHVIEQLTRLNILGTGDNAPKSALDDFTDAQFYAFLNHSVRNKAIDRLRKRRVPTSTLTELERSGGEEDESPPMDSIVQSLWGHAPFATPEEAAIEAASNASLRRLLKECILALRGAPRQLQAVLKELSDLGIDDLIQEIRSESGELLTDLPLEHASQHKDHAHKKLRYCLQKSSTNLAVIVALRLSEYEEVSTGSHYCVVELKALQMNDLSEKEVRTGLQHLVTEGLLNWHGEETVRFSFEERKHLARFYEEGE
jgi:DNA-directed RNA polymerase specialized sigma24 family protein